jgi:hypothetical protein
MYAKHTSQRAVRAVFWFRHPEFSRRRGFSQNDYPTDVRCAFVDFVEALARAGEITENMAQRVTL